MATRNAVKIGQRVALRPLEVGDARAIALAGHLEDDAGLLMDGRVPTSVLAFEAWIRRLGEARVPEAMTFAICRAGKDACIGTASIRHIDWVNRTAETGSGLLWPADRNQGLGTEAKLLLLEYAFVDLGLHALSSFVFAGNARSARALEKQGYRLAGRLTAEVQRGGAFHDYLVYDVLRADWERARNGQR
jgi:RimJ/RimL family protein N-acetyltransferase